jgi:molybdopterin synthase catalytic subunit
LHLTVRVQVEDFDAGAEIAAMRLANPAIGAVVSFVGQVRDLNDGENVQTLTLEHYPEMTQKSLQAIELQAKNNWQVLDSLIVHRVGTLKPLDQIVLVLVASAHRSDAFKACEFMMDYLKTQAPFWKKEAGNLGERWIEAKVTDDLAVKRWNTPK